MTNLNTQSVRDVLLSLVEALDVSETNTALTAELEEGDAIVSAATGAFTGHVIAVISKRDGSPRYVAEDGNGNMLTFKRERLLKM